MKQIKPKNEFEQVAILIEEARGRAFQKVNEELVLLYFKVGSIVSAKVAEGVWGEGTVEELANYIAVKTPGMGGFTRRGLYRMKQFYETYFIGSDCFKYWITIQKTETSILNISSSQLPQDGSKSIATPIVATLPTQLQVPDKQHDKFVSTLLTQIQWSSHLHILSKTKAVEEKLFYLLSAVTEKWSVRDLERQLNSAVFERTSLANNRVSSVRTQLPQNLFKDPYIFEFLDLPDGHSEKDLEKALLLNLQKFILEIGKGFTYMGAQYRLQVGNKDYHTDLLFYHRDLQCLVLFGLKIEEFEPEGGKLNFYLEALDRDVKRPFENNSVGVLLCKGKDTEVVEYAMARTTSPAMIADYETKLIPKNVLATKLNQLVSQLSKEEES